MSKSASATMVPLEAPGTITQRPSVGRIVHFYSRKVADRDPARAGYGLNGQGEGPYPAIVLQVSSGGQYVNLRVMGWGEASWDEGSVSDDKTVSPNRYWEWPPR